MVQLVHKVVKFLSLGWFFQSGYSQVQFSFGFNGVVNTSDSFPSNWIVTSNLHHSNSLGTFQSVDLLNDPFYFTTHLFNSSASGSIAKYQKLATENCTIAEDTLKIVFPTITDAFYLYALAGKYCLDDGLLKITHLKVSDKQLVETATITASGFSPIEDKNDDSMWTVLPRSNYGKSDVISVHYSEDTKMLSVSRAGVKLGEKGRPLHINITGSDYDLELKQKNLSHEYYDLSTLPDNSLIQWYYRRRYLAVGVLTIGSRTVVLNRYTENSQVGSNQITLPESNDTIMYHMSLHPLNDSAFLVYNQIINPDNTSLPFVYLLHAVSFEGKLESIGNKSTNGVAAILTLEGPHRFFVQGSTLVLENTALSNPNLTYFHNQQYESYLLPDSPWWLLSESDDNAVLVEAKDALKLVEMQKLETEGFELGCYNLPWEQSPHSSTITPSPTISNNRSTFFDTVVNAQSEPTNYLVLGLGLTAAFLLLAASSIGCYFLLCNRKREHYQELKEAPIYNV